MNQQQKQIKNIIFNNLDSLYNSCKIVSKEWKTNTISIVYLKEAVKIARPKGLDDNPNLKEFMTNYDKTIESIVTMCENQAVIMDKKSIPLSYLKEKIDFVKKAFLKGLKSQ